MYRAFLKRFLDLFGALVLLPILIVEVFILAPFIWWTDKGSVFYNATRAGLGYRPFRMYKLRTMYLNAPDLRNSDGSTYSADDDPRVTPVGRFLRRTSLDELPQLLNVLLGDMSFVGPRPKLYLPENYPDGLPPEKMRSFRVRPGITGYAQAYFRNGISQDEKFYWDAFYAESLSFAMDVKILWKTFFSVLSQKNINVSK